VGHLGSERVVISDVKEPNSGLGSEFYTTNISVSNYYPFGSLMSDISRSSEAYRYGYNGKENDDEISGKNAITDYGARTYMNRLGKFMSTDPLKSKFPNQSSYIYAGNNPILFIDKNGEVKYHYSLEFNKSTKPELTYRGKTEENIPGGRYIIHTNQTVSIPYDNRTGFGIREDEITFEYGSPYILQEEGAKLTPETLAGKAKSMKLEGYLLQGFANVEKEYKESRSGRTGSNKWKGPLKYDEIPGPKKIKAGGEFGKKQKELIKKKNLGMNKGKARSDKDGTTLNPSKRNIKGQKADMNQAEVDHIKARSKGGTNKTSNLRVISKEENAKKGNK
jgi:RHS repeat-associated protein